MLYLWHCPDSKLFTWCQIEIRTYFTYKLVEIAPTGQVGIHCSQTIQRDRVKFNRNVSGSRFRASVGQTPVHSPQSTQTSSSTNISLFAVDTWIPWERIQSIDASSSSISPDSSTTNFPIWLGATWARIILAATLKSFASRYATGIWMARLGKVRVTRFFTMARR